MRVKCLAQEHNTMTPARARTRTARSGDERTNHEATVPPTDTLVTLLFLTNFLLYNDFSLNKLTTLSEVSGILTDFTQTSTPAV